MHNWCRYGLGDISPDLMADCLTAVSHLTLRNTALDYQQVNTSTPWSAVTASRCSPCCPGQRTPPRPASPASSTSGTTRCRQWLALGRAVPHSAAGDPAAAPHCRAPPPGQPQIQQLQARIVNNNSRSHILYWKFCLVTWGARPGCTSVCSGANTISCSRTGPASQWWIFNKIHLLVGNKYNIYAKTTVGLIYPVDGGRSCRARSCRCLPAQIQTIMWRRMIKRYLGRFPSVILSKFIFQTTECFVLDFWVRRDEICWVILMLFGVLHYIRNILTEFYR